MKIDYVKTAGFRKFKEIFESDLYDITNITGKNRAGKSNILYAILNIMLGTNLSGDEKACLVNKHCSESYGELHFTDNNGEKHILIRNKSKYSNKGNVIVLDGKVIKQEELIRFYKDKKLFLSIINPLFFLSKKPAEQKEMVDKYLSDIKPKVIFDRLDKDTQKMLLDKYYKDTKKNYDELTEKEQEKFINTNMYGICMDVAYSNLSNEEQKLLEGVPIDIPTYISELNTDIKNAENYISTLDGKIEYAENIANEKLEKYKSFEKDEELKFAEMELSHLTTDENMPEKEKTKQNIEQYEKDIASMENEFNELDKTMKAGKQQYLYIKNGTVCTCPTCKQQIKDESKVATLETMHKDLMDKYDKRTSLETQITDQKIKLATEKCKYHALDGKPDEEKAKRIAEVEASIKQLEQEKSDIDKFNSEIKVKEQNINNAKLDIDKFNKERQEKHKFIDNLTKAKKVAQKLYISYIEEKMKLAKEYLTDVNIKFYSVLKTTGEIKDGAKRSYLKRIGTY